MFFKPMVQLMYSKAIFVAVDNYSSSINYLVKFGAVSVQPNMQVVKSTTYIGFLT